MTEENKDSLIEDLKSDRERLKERYEKLVLAHNDLNVKYEILAKEYHEMCEHCESLTKRLHVNYSESFKKGQEDFQIKAKKILDTFDEWDADVLVDVFGVSTNIELLYDIKTNYEKIIAYEQIKIGDVVKNVGSGKPLLVYKVASPYVYILDRDGQNGVRSEKDVIKTGKHYDLDKILKANFLIFLFSVILGFNPAEPVKTSLSQKFLSLYSPFNAILPPKEWAIKCGLTILCLYLYSLTSSI
jgi:hypothetical protein